jgi:hypothetical protein
MNDGCAELILAVRCRLAATPYMPSFVNTHPGSRPLRRLFLGACAGIGCVALLKKDAIAIASSHASPSHGALSMAEAEMRRAEQRGELCSGANAVGVGLRGEYFAGERLQGAALLVRIDGSIDFDPSLGWPAERAREKPRSVRWSGWIKPPISGQYRFHLDAPDARVVVAKQVLVGEESPPDSRIEMVAGRYYPVTLELRRIPSGDSRIRLEWTAPHGARFLVSRALLFLPTEAIAPARG